MGTAQSQIIFKSLHKLLLVNIVRLIPKVLLAHDFNEIRPFPFCATNLPFLLTYQSAEFLQNFIEGGRWQLTHKLYLSSFPIKAFYLV